VSRCYEVRTTEPARLPLAAFTLAVDLEPEAQLERYPGGLIPLGWAADARDPPPLALPPVPPAGAGLPFAGGGGILAAPGALPLPAPRGSPEPLAPPQLPWVGAGAGAPGALGGRYARPGSGGGASPRAGGAVYDSPHGGPPPYAAGALPGFGARPWGGGEEGDEDGGSRGDAVRLGSPAHPAYGGGAGAAPDAGGSTAFYGARHAGPSSPSLPALIKAASPTRPGAAAGAGASRLRDALSDSLDSGRRAVSAAAAAIADAEAAVMRSGGGGGGGGQGGGGGSPTRAGAAGAPAAESPPRLEPLRWSLQQSAAAVSGLAAALNAAATELHGPEPAAPPAPLPGGAWGGAALAPPPAAARSPEALEDGAPGGDWGGDAAARDLQGEVLRLRTEVRGRAAEWGA
jgi:hypothetical protein